MYTSSMPAWDLKKNQDLTSVSVLVVVVEAKLCICLNPPNAGPVQMWARK